MSALMRDALDPERSVVVEACAGSGKTWLLVSRLVRLLLSGAAPGEILAITFTRKAAREIEDRLRHWLRELATLPEPAALAFLCERGLDEAAAVAALPDARCLHERLLQAQPGLTISTFHGWFASLVKAAPMETGLAGLSLAESEARLRDEAWDTFASRCAREPEGAPAQGLLALLSDIGMGNTRALLNRFVARRAEWHVWRGADSLDAALSRIGEDLGADLECSAAGRFAAGIGVVDGLGSFASLLLQRKAAGEKAHGESLKSALESCRDDPEALLAAIAPVFLTQKGELRARKLGKTVTDELKGGAAAYLALHESLGLAVQQALREQSDEQVLAFNIQALQAGTALLAAYEDHKQQRRLMDFADLEWLVDRMLADEGVAAYVQARLDARYRHILLDEFQDTNPLQWRILRGWLGAYSEGVELPRIFLVGDPKQSIYRFRRAEPRIFDAAAEYLAREFGAVRHANTLTRRNAGGLVDVVNALFDAADGYSGFQAHQAWHEALPARVEVLPLCGHEGNGPGEEGAVSGGGAGAGEAVAPEPDDARCLRDPLTQPLVREDDQRRRKEAALGVARLQAAIGQWQVEDAVGARPARWGDLMILCRRRAGLAEIELALRQAGIPYLGAGRGGLLQTLEALDLAALLRFLATPSDDLALAHVLRTPLFGAPDAALQRIALTEGGSWWSRLGLVADLDRGPLEEPHGYWLSGRAAPRGASLLAFSHARLSDWIQAADRLPVHDLLDRIYGEGDLLARYQAAVPEAAWAGVRANLEAFIELALQLDAGRYPSLPRFIEELDRLGQDGEDDAPDEGVISTADAGNRVRLMTIHASKGLEAPIVWLADAANTHRTPDNYSALVGWPPESDEPVHFSLVGSQATRGHARAALFQAEEAAAEREDLNLLYVAMTRARQVLLVSGIEGGRGSSRISFHQRIADAVAAAGGEDGIVGALATCRGEPEKPVAHEGAPVATTESVVPRPTVGQRRTVAASHGMAFGTLLHAVLENLTGPGARLPLRPFGVAEGEWEQVVSLARALLAKPDLAPFFTPGQYVRAWNECSFALADGQVGRIDRLVETADTLWVLDYKSGEADDALLAKYASQLAAYRAAVAQARPGKPVRSALVFADGRLQEMT